MEKAKRQMLNFVRRVNGQFQNDQERLKRLGKRTEKQAMERFLVVKELYEQQRRIYR